MHPDLRIIKPPCEKDETCICIMPVRFSALKLHSVTPHAKAYFEEKSFTHANTVLKLALPFHPFLPPYGSSLATGVLNGTVNVLEISKKKS